MDGTYRELLSGPRRSETSAETSRKPKGAPSSFKLIYPVQNSNNINYRVNSYSTRLVNSIALFPDQVIPQMKRRLICMHHWSIHLNVTISRLTFCLFLLRKFVGVIFTPPDITSEIYNWKFQPKGINNNEETKKNCNEEEGERLKYDRDAMTTYKESPKNLSASHDHDVTEVMKSHLP